MVAGVSELGALGSGTGDFRIEPKVQLVRGVVDVSVIGAVTVPTGRAVDYRGDDGVTFSPTVALGLRRDAWRFAAVAGYRVRPEARLGNLTVDDEAFGKLAAGFVFWPSRGELVASLSATTSNYLEVIAGPTMQLGGATVFAAGGVGLESGYGTPDWRALAGVRIAATD